jgi:hypothetical protein
MSNRSLLDRSRFEIMKHTIWFFTCGLALAGCTLAGPADVASEQQALTQDVRLFGYRTNTGQPLDWWVDTGIQVAAGSTVSVGCFGAGRNLPWGGDTQFDCAGDLSQGPWPLSIAPACRFGSLVGKIGGNGARACLGPSASFTAGSSGSLHLGFNDGENFQDNSGFWDIHVDVTPPVTPGWSPSPHPGGPSWVWNQDPALRVVLADDNAEAPWGRGLYFVYDGQVHGSLVGNHPTCDTRWVPQILVTPRGGDPLISAADELVLAVTGSGEHGCDALGYHQATATISAQATSAGIDITAAIDGTAYFAFPPMGTIQVQHSGGSSESTEASLLADGTVPQKLYEGAGVTSASSSGSALGTITLDVNPALPWLQLVGGTRCTDGSPSGFIEVDVDHSCEPGFMRPTFTLSTHITQ